MPAEPLTYYIEQLKASDDILQTAGKPQSLNVTGDALYWLQGEQQEIYTVSLTDLNSTPRPLIPPRVGEESSKSSGEFRPETKEEELMRERLRRRVVGINGYHIISPGDTVLYTTESNMFMYRRSSSRPPVNVFDYISKETRQRYFGDENKPFLCLHYLEKSNKCHESNATQSVNDITFVCGSNLYIATIVAQNDPTAQDPIRVDLECVTTFGDALHECGTSDYIMQEEFERYTGHYATANYVLFSYTDTSMLKSVSLIDGSSKSGVESMTYAWVGDPNAHTVLLVYERKTKRFRVVPEKSIQSVCPWVEYIPRFGFKNDDTIYFSLLSRSQEQYSVLSCRIDALPEVDAAVLPTLFSMDPAGDNVMTKMVSFTTEWEENIPWAWVEVLRGPPIIFGKTHDVLVRHATESKTAHSHIYVREAGTGVKAWRPLTQGEWNVKPGSVRVLNDKVVFLANVENRLGSVLYSVPLVPPSSANSPATSAAQLTRLSRLHEHVHSHTVRSDYLCYVASTATTPAELYVTSLLHPELRRTVRTNFNSAEKGKEECGGGGGKTTTTTSHAHSGGLVNTELITTISRRGVPLSGRLFISPAVVAGKPAPLALYIYGGPRAQLVFENDYDLVCKPLFQTLAKNGISVLVADGQMSNANGLRNLSICKRNMGNFETSDYVDIVKHMTTSSLPQSGFIADAARVAIFGWSYGGYATLLAMSQAADVFKLGFAGAPVSDWALYDTGYTERYMGELYENPAGDEKETNKVVSEAYTRSAIKHFVSGFPDDLNRVFVAHGLLDENVHFAHTCELMKAMVDAAKPCSLLTYPGERHGLRQKAASRHHNDAMIIKTMVELL